MDAAWDAHFIRMADKLIELLKAAPLTPAEERDDLKAKLAEAEVSPTRFIAHYVRMADKLIELLKEGSA